MTSLAESKELSLLIKLIIITLSIIIIIKIIDTLPICKTLLLTAMTDGLGVLF